MRAQWEKADAAVRLEFPQAAAEIRFDTCGGLVAFLRHLRQKLHHDARSRAGALGACSLGGTGWRAMWQ